MSKLIDLTGQRFGRLIVLQRAENKIHPSGQAATSWFCICNCGNTTIATSSDLKKGNVKSCGCLQDEINSLTHKKYNKYKLFDGYVEMFTSKNEVFYVDADDFDRVKDVCWFKDQHGYLVGYRDGEYIQLHRLVTNCPENMIVDHIGGSTTIHDNRKSNLRIVTHSQNSMNRALAINNTSGITGVSWDNQMGKWRVQIGINRERKHLGLYDDFDDAVKVRKEAEEKYFGKYSYNNSQQNNT